MPGPEGQDDSPPTPGGPSSSPGEDDFYSPERDWALVARYGKTVVIEAVIRG